VELRFFEKRPFKEIAEILDITEVNAKVRMYRLVEKLKKSLSKIKI
jgi:RNA polymerase sigma-70 factor (ECF subfamily)